MNKAKIKLLGTGMSHGVPLIGCQCQTCQSDDVHDKRFRTSALLIGPQSTILFDCGADFRVQSIQYKIQKITAVLISHVHADHIFGIDDLRAFSKINPIPLYSTKESLKDIYDHFDYIFKVTQIGGGKPKLDLKEINESPFQINEFSIVPIPLIHDYPNTYGFRIGDTAYLTDMSGMEEKSFSLLEGTQQVIIDAVRPGRIKNHLSFEKAIDVIEKIHPKRAFFTHIDHTLKHSEIQEFIDKFVADRPKLKDVVIQPGYDGLELDVCF